MKVIRFANVLIFNQQGKALFLRRTASHRTSPLSLDIPGGGLEPDESFKQAAVREVREETGLDIQTEDIILFTRRKQISHGRSLEGALFYAKNRIADDAPIVVSDEHDSYSWLN